jgi:hypothetical protein
MDWGYILNSHLINLTDEYSGFQTYNICKYAAIVNCETGEFLASTQYFKVKFKKIRLYIFLTNFFIFFTFSFMKKNSKNLRRFTICFT